MDHDTASNAKKFFEQIRNPYLFKVDDVIVHVKFGAPTTKPLQSHIHNLLTNSAYSGA